MNTRIEDLQRKLSAKEEEYKKQLDSFKSDVEYGNTKSACYEKNLINSLTAMIETKTAIDFLNRSLEMEMLYKCSEN